MYIYIYTYIYIYICIYIYIRIYIYIFEYRSTYLSIYLFIYLCIFIYISLYRCIYIYTYVHVYVCPQSPLANPFGRKAEDDAEGIPFGRAIAGQKAQRKLLSRGETRTNEGGNDLMGGITRYLRDILGGTPLAGWFLFGKIPLKLMRGTPIHGNTRFYGIHNSQIMAMDINGIWMTRFDEQMVIIIWAMKALPRFPI